jgi:hypothetical protein
MMMTDLELLTHHQCPCTPSMQARLLDALRTLRGWWTYRLIPQHTLSAADVRRWYPAPTVLHRGRDLFGLQAAPEYAGLT